MDEKEETLLIKEDQLSFEEIISMVQNLQGEVEEMKNSLDIRAFGKTEYQDKDILITKGIVSVGFENDVLIISGIDETYRMWAGNEDPDLANFKVDKDGNITSVGGNITGGTITGATIQTAATGQRLRMAGSPANEYQFLEDDTKVGHLKIEDDGAGGYYAEIFIDHLGSSLQVGSTVGAAENVYFSTVGFSSSIRAAVGYVQLTSKDGFVFGLEWSGGGDPLIVTNALPSSDPGVSGALWNDLGYVAVSP